MNTHEYYVSLETAKMLKEAGFDWRCMKCYNHEVMFDMESDEIRKQCPQHSQWDIPTPTLEVAQRWMREVKGIEVNVLCVYVKHIKKYSYDVFTNEYEHELIKEGFDTYEEALEAGIKKCLKEYCITDKYSEE